MSQIYPQLENLSNNFAVVDQQFCRATATTLTVWNKSLLFSGEGFTVFDSDGDLLFRMETYALANNHLTLMDAQGKPLLTLRRKLPSLHHRWEGFLGDNLDGQKPLFTVRKSSILPSKECVQVFMSCGFFWKPCPDFEIEGSFSQRCCTIFANAPRMVAAEVKRKCGTGGTLLGRDVFSLCIERGFDQAFMMGLIIVLEQIFPGDSELPLVKMVVNEVKSLQKNKLDPEELPSLHHRWEGYLGDKLEGQEPVFTVMKSSILPTKECVQVFMNCGFFWKPCSDYEVEGSFSQRCCTIFTNAPRKAAAEVKRKSGCPGTMLGTDVFSLIIQPGFDQGFMVGLIIILEQISLATMSFLS